MSEDIKIEIGKRIREERERQGLTREHVCDTEEELTVKTIFFQFYFIQFLLA